MQVIRKYFPFKNHKETSIESSNPPDLKRVKFNNINENASSTSTARISSSKNNEEMKLISLSCINPTQSILKEDTLNQSKSPNVDPLKALTDESKIDESKSNDPSPNSVEKKTLVNSRV